MEEAAISTSWYTLELIDQVMIDIKIRIILVQHFIFPDPHCLIGEEVQNWCTIWTACHLVEGTKSSAAFHIS